MGEASRFDAVVVGGGPNGLAAGITLARAGLSVCLYEAADQVGGGLSSDELTEPGFTHDLCSAIHPLAIASPFLRALPLEDFGLSWVHPDAPYAHPFEGADAAIAHRDFASTGATIGADGERWRRLFEPLTRRWRILFDDVLQPIIRIPRHPFLLARFGLPALVPAQTLCKLLFSQGKARGLFAGVAGHSLISLRDPASSAVAMMLCTAAHAVGWPFPRGGAQRLADAMAAYLTSLGGTIVTGRRIERLKELDAPLVLLDVTPAQLLVMAEDLLDDRYRRSLQRFEYGPGVFKIDYALSAPVPWSDPACQHAATVHVGGTIDEIAASEHAVSSGRIPEAPFVLTAQQSLFDETRAPAGRHTFWAYCHVPNGSSVDMTTRIEAQIERFAPGFRDVILSRHVAGPAEMEARNPNLIGGDINGGAATFKQLIARPVLRPVPYRTSLRGVYLCSASTPPGGGIHGMCGHNAARVALNDIGATSSVPLHRRPD